MNTSSPTLLCNKTAWISLSLIGTFAFGEPKPAIPFSDHMVLQRDMANPVWGTADPSEKISVSIAGQNKHTTAGKDGSWQVNLDPLKVGGPHQLVIAGTDKTLTYKDVLVGEVWLGSGQSNMAGGAGGYAKNNPPLAKIIEQAPYPNLRLLHNKGAAWKVADAKACASFSAILLSFGVPLHKELDVPVGLMLGAVGGTPSGRWLTKEMLEDDAGVSQALKQWNKAHDLDKELAAYDKALAKWEKLAAEAKAQKKRAPRKPQKPVQGGDFAGRRVGDLYDAFINRLVPYGMRGVLWDQGESGTSIRELDQYVTMGALIRGWRQAWGQGDFPFLYVQKPSGYSSAYKVNKDDLETMLANPFATLPSKANPDDRGGLYRELHVRIRNHPNTAMVTALDLGPGVHPRNKAGYGARGARVALGFVYGQDHAIYGPSYKSQVIEGNLVRVGFSDLGIGLAIGQGTKLQGFAIAGKDKVFHWANAKIEGDYVVLSSSEVKAPVAVRYGWARKREWANLFNKDGLPATTFRTDDW
ncbi:MAG: hypothetical protein VCA36_00445 [Opitutales bacterium]